MSSMPAKKSSTALVDTVQKNTTKQPPQGIVVRGAKMNNLKDVSCTIPYEKVTVVTGPSGSGKSTLAFDTIYAEGQRRFLESLSSYARQFMTRFEKPEVDEISNILPTIALEQKNTIKNARSTVGTVTEIDDYLRLLFSSIAYLTNEQGERLEANTPQSIADKIMHYPERTKVMLTATVLADEEKITELKQLGFYRHVLADASIAELEAITGDKPTKKASRKKATITAATQGQSIQLLLDRVVTGEGLDLIRLLQSLEQGLKLQASQIVLFTQLPTATAFTPQVFELDNAVLEKKLPHHFSFNSPLGACTSCEGYGKVIGLDLDKVIPNRKLSLRQGAVHPFNSPANRELYELMLHEGKKLKVDLESPYEQLSEQDKAFVLNGHGHYEGIHAFFNWLESKKYKIHVRVMLAKYRSYTRCGTCFGSRIKPEMLRYKIADTDIFQLSTMPVDTLISWFESLTLPAVEQALSQRLLQELLGRLYCLQQLGLGYLTLARQSRTLSGGEAQRIHLASALGTQLTDTLYVLDEPTVGLHARDTEQLLLVLQHLRDAGNTVLVVEHDPDMILGADEVIELGPEGGSDGGYLIHQGSVASLMANNLSKTAQYIQQLQQSPPKLSSNIPHHNNPTFGVENATGNNLKNLTVTFPTAQLVCVSGVSGSGKSTLIKQTLYAQYQQAKGEELMIEAGPCAALHGLEQFEDVVLVDQSPPGRSMRSNPATYTKAYEDIRKLMANSRQAKVLGLTASDFSFNSPGGRCEKCEGLGTLSIDMQFMADVTVTCPDCRGKRFMPSVLSIEVEDRSGQGSKNIYDILNLTIEEAMPFFAGHKAITTKLQPLLDVGLGYLKLGQSTSTLSGGESQRLKLSGYLGQTALNHRQKPYLLLFDEPSTGLHINDIERLVSVFRQLLSQGHSLVVIEHNIDVLLHADWLVDIGPEGGSAGGEIVAQGPLKQVLDNKQSLTAKYLKQRLTGA